MFRSALCIKMLMILFTRDVVSIKDLSDELDTNPRNIPEYRKELEAAGYPIETVSGRYGGYRLKKTDFFPTVRLTDAEKKAMVESFEYITKRGDLPSMPAYKTAMEKMMAANRYRTTKDSELIMIPRYPFSMSEEDFQVRYSLVSDCVEHQNKLKISFRSNDNVVRDRVIHPYKVYMYDNAWSVLGYCELVEDMRTFEFHRITALDKLPKKFDYIYSYRECGEWHEYLDKLGMKKVPDWSADLGGKDAPMRIKLLLTGKPAMYAKDYLYGTDQVIQEIDKDTTILEFTAKYKYNTVQLVLGFGADCKVIEPEWLKEDVILKSKEIIKKYNI